MRTSSLGRIFLLACGLSAPASASVVFSYAADAPSYTGSVGSIVPVSIYLQETLTSGSTSFITNTGGGLTGAGAAVNVVGTTGGTAASFGTSNTPFTSALTFGNAATAPGSLVYNQGTGAAANNLEFLQNITNTQSTVQPTADATGDRVLLGVLDVQVGSGTTTYNLTSLANDTINNSSSALGQSDGNTTTKLPTASGGTDLDMPGGSAFTGGDAAAAYQFTVAPTTSPVPEPASMAIFGLGAAGLLIKRQRKA